MANDVILVVGATGNTGTGVVAGLLGQGRKVRALARDAAKAKGLKNQGAEVVVGDLDDAATLIPALFADVSRVYLLTWNGPTATQQSKNFLGAMKAAGASPRIVRLSAYGAAHSEIIKDLRVAEQDLKDVGVEWTILQPTFFMQNTMMAAQSVQEMGMVFFDWADDKAGMIGALTTDGDEFVGKEVSYVSVPHEKAKESMVGMGLLESIVDGFVELAEGFEAGFADLTTDSVQQLAGYAPRSFDEFASDFRSAWGG